METSNVLMNSIENVMHLMDNSILMLRDFDKALSKLGFEPINGNAIGTETSKSIYQSSEQYATFFPQYMARPYALKSDLDGQKVNKIIFINLQFFHADYTELPPSFIGSVIVLPTPIANIKNEVKSWWLKYFAFEYLNWEDLKKNGDKNEVIDEDHYKNIIIWCRDLTSFDGQNSIKLESEKLVEVFNTL